MPDSIYKVIEVVGTSPNSWEEAARNAIETAARSLRDLRVAEITKLDMRLEDNRIVTFRTRVSLSFKYDIDVDEEAEAPAASTVRAPRGRARRR